MFVFRILFRAILGAVVVSCIKVIKENCVEIKATLTTLTQCMFHICHIAFQRNARSPEKIF